jgi:hypothetical protein
VKVAENAAVADPPKVQKEAEAAKLRRADAVSEVLITKEQD